MAAQGYINANTPIPICCNHASGSNWENNHYTPHLKRIQSEGGEKRSFNATYDKNAKPQLLLPLHFALLVG